MRFKGATILLRVEHDFIDVAADKLRKDRLYLEVK